MVAKRIILNETSFFGPGSRSVIADLVLQRGFRKAFVVTDKDLMKHQVAPKVLEVLDNAQIPFAVFDDVKQNPTVANVQAGVEGFMASGSDFIVAVGGGSPIDTAKAIGIIIANPEFSDVCSLEGVADTKNKSVPIIALPTTAGTGAEVTINYVITDEANVKKMVCVDPNDIPAVAIVDSELMTSMPKSLTAATGMDALTHAIEGYITQGAWELSDTFALKSIELIASHLETAVACPDDLVARDGMALAQYVAGMGFSNVGLGIVHSMAHPLGAHYDIPHGVANALLLPYVMDYNGPATGSKYREIARVMGVPGINSMSEDDARTAAVKAVKSLSLRIGIPQKLSEIGVQENDLPKLAKSALEDVCTPGNPRETSYEDILGLYQLAY